MKEKEAVRDWSGFDTERLERLRYSIASEVEGNLRALREIETELDRRGEQVDFFEDPPR